MKRPVKRLFNKGFIGEAVKRWFLLNGLSQKSGMDLVALVMKLHFIDELAESRSMRTDKI